MKQGFSLIELLIVILIISILATVTVPRFTRGTVTAAQKFMNNLNKMVSDGIKHSVANGQGAEVVLNLKSRKIELYTTEKTPSKYAEIPAAVEVLDFFVNGKNAFSSGGGERISAYFYINSDGMPQEVKIVFNDKSTQKNNISRSYEIEMNPFTAKFKI